MIALWEGPAEAEEAALLDPLYTAHGGLENTPSPILVTGSLPRPGPPNTNETLREAFRNRP